MPTHRSFRAANCPLDVVRAVAIGSILSALLPAGATGMAEPRRDPSGQVFPVPSAQRGLPLPASALRVPVQLHLRTPERARYPGLDIVATTRDDVTSTRPPVGFRQTPPIRPTVTILAPMDQAAVPVGLLRVRGTVSPAGDGVRVFVNGVRAVVQAGAFSAPVRVSPHTVILSAVATTSGGPSDCHQIGLAVGEGPEKSLRLRSVPDRAVVPIAQHGSLSFAAGLPSANRESDVEDAGDSQTGPPGIPRFAVGRPVTRSSPSPQNGVPDSGGAPLSLALAPARPDGHVYPTEPGLPETDRGAAAEATRRAPAVRPRLEGRVETVTPNDSGSSGRALTGTGSLSPGARGEGEVEQNPRGLPFGATYSIGLLFIFDTEGFRQVRWY